MAAETLKELIRTCGAGDKEAFRTLVELFEDRLFAYIHARVRSREDALDILQDVLVDVWRALPRFTYKADAAFYGFVYTIAKRRIYARWEAGDDARLPDGLADTHREDTEERLAIEEALQTLDEMSREIVLLKHWSRYTFSEIGGMLDMAEGAVRVRHHRALKTLHDSLTPYAS